MCTARGMETNGKILHSSASGFGLSSAQPMAATMHLKVFTARAQLVDHNSLLVSQVQRKW